MSKLSYKLSALICILFAMNESYARECHFNVDTDKKQILLEFQGRISNGRISNEVENPNHVSQVICTLSETDEEEQILDGGALISSFWKFFAPQAHAEQVESRNQRLYVCKNAEGELESKFEIAELSYDIGFLGLMECRRALGLNFNLCLYNWKLC